MTGDREGTQLGAVMLSLGWEERFRSTFQEPLLVLNSVVKRTKYKYFLMNNGKRRLEKLPKSVRVDVSERE